MTCVPPVPAVREAERTGTRRTGALTNFAKKNKITIRDILSWLEIRLIKAIRSPRGTQRYPKAGIWAWQTLLRTTISDSEWLPAETAGRRLTSLLRPRNFEQEKQRKYWVKYFLRISRARPGRRPVRLESRGPGRPTARGIGISQAGSSFGISQTG